MKILYVASIGGFFPFFKDLIRKLLDDGHIVDFAANYSEWPLPEYYRDWGCKSYDIPIERNPIKYSNLSVAKRIKNIVEENGYEIVHCHTPVASICTRWGCRKLRSKGVKVIYTAHGFHFYTGAPIVNWLLYYPVEWVCSWWTDTLITINKEDYKRAKKCLHAKRIEYVPGVGVDTKKFAICKVDRSEKRAVLGLADSDFVLLSVGKLSERNNQKMIIKALHKMKEKGTIDNIVYLMVGNGDQEEIFRNLVSEYDLNDHIKLLGFRTDIDELCEVVDCFVHLSIREGLGIALLEAMAAGLPLISSQVNGNKDYTENEVSGCCVNLERVDDIVLAIQRMHDDKAFREKCAFNNRRKSKNFDIKITDEIMKKAYGGGYAHLASILVRQNKRREFGIGIYDFVLISVGELNDNKNHQVIIRAIAKIPDVKYVVVGKGVLEDRLRRLAIEQNVSERVIFTGFRTDVKDLLCMSDCFAFPSKREGLGIAALEAMVAGLPVIGHEIGGIRDYIIDGETGVLVKSNDNVDLYRSAIEKCLFEIDLYGCAVKSANIAKKFSIRESNSIMKNIYAHC